MADDTLQGDLAQVDTREQAYGQEVAQVGATMREGAEADVQQADAAGAARIARAEEHAASMQPFTQEGPQDQINKVMAGAPFLFALTALGGKASKINGMAMLEGLNGVSAGILAGNKEALDQNWKRYDAAFEKWKTTADLQDRVFKELDAAYSGAADGSLRAHMAAHAITNDTMQMQLTVDDPKTWADIKSKVIDSHAKLMDARAKMQAAGGGPPGSLPQGWSQEEIDYYARQSLAGDQTWRVGLSRQAAGSQIIRAVDKRVPELAKLAGISPEQASTTKDIRKSLDSALNDRQKFVAAGTQFVSNFQKQTALVEKYLGAGAAGSVPAINRWIQAGRKSLAGDPDVTAFDTAIRGLAREHQRIVTGMTSNAQLHASAQSTADELLNKDMTADQVRATLQVMGEEANNALASGRQEIGELQHQLSQIGVAGTAAAGAPPPPERKIVDIGTSQSDGKTYVRYSDGTVEPFVRP